MSGRAAPDRLMTVWPSPARRFFGAGMTVGLALLLVWMAVIAPAGAGAWRAAFAGAAAAGLWAGWRQWRATEAGLVLTDDGLFDTTGERLAALDDIVSVDRGAFAFKPSGGFLMRLRTPAPRHWSPGLWWRFGRLVGVGGMTPSAETRAMADRLTLMLPTAPGPG